MKGQQPALEVIVLKRNINTQECNCASKLFIKYKTTSTDENDLLDVNVELVMD